MPIFFSNLPRYVPLMLGGFTVCSMAQAAEPDYRIEWDAMATAYSPAQPIHAFINEWSQPLTSGNHAYAQGRTALTVVPKDSNIRYGIGWRYDYLMEFSDDAALLYWQYKNKALPTAASAYQLDLNAKHNERFGFNVGTSYALTPNWNISAQGNAWRGLHVLEGELQGNASSQMLLNTENIKSLERLDSAGIQVDYYYDKPALKEENLNWYPDKPTGYGYSLDIGVQGQVGKETTLTLQAYDVLGKMHWQDAPQTQYIIDYDSNRRPIDKTGGQLSTKDVTQSLPWRVEGSLNHQLSDKWQVSAHGQINDVQSLYQLEASYQPDLMSSLTVSAMAEPQTQAFGIGLAGAYGGVKVLTDDIDFNRAQRSEVQLYGRYAW